MSNNSFAVDVFGKLTPVAATAATNIVLGAFPSAAAVGGNSTTRTGAGWPISLLQVALALLTIAGLRIVKFFADYRVARREFPSPPISSIWRGNLPELLVDNVHERWRQWHNELGPWNGLFSRVIYVGDPALVAKIANSNWAKFPPQYAGFKPLSGDALFAQMDPARWKIQRRALAPAFQQRTIDAQYGALRGYLRQFIAQLDVASVADATSDLSSLHVLLTLDFVGSVAFGAELHALEDGEDRCAILQHFRDILPELMKCGLFPLRAKIPILASTRRMHAAISALRGMGLAAVRSAREGDAPAGEEKRIFEILARQRDDNGEYMFSPKELILRNREVYAKLRAELDAAIPADIDVPLLEQVSGLKYLTMVLKETLRMHGPGFGTFRYTDKEAEINGVHIPANTTLALWNPQVHRDKNIWGPNVDEFCPERWEQGLQSTGAPPGAYFPFSYGPRKCLGEGLAMLEMRLTLATLFRRYDVQLKDGFEMEFLAAFTLCSKNGLPVTTKLRV
ncbi:cytochrome P450 46A1 [Peniophora sp. CONT]|nr:cytochrome P450 46A1 [Peniophora sp. CONT]